MAELDRIRAGMRSVAGVIKEQFPGIGQGQEKESIFRVHTISNGWIAVYADVEEYTVKVPVLRAPGPSRAGMTIPPRAAGHVETDERRRWKLVVREVYCADAEALKIQVDEALKLNEKVRLKQAETVLSGDEDLEYGVVA